MRKVYSGELFVGYLFENWMNPLTALAIRYTKDNQGYYLSSLIEENIAMEQALEVNPKPRLGLIRGGKDDSQLPPTTGNWLLDLPIGTMFTVQSRENPKNFMALDLELVNKTSRTALLHEVSTGQPLGGTGRVVASRFVSQFDKIENLESYEDMLVRFQQEQEKQEAEHGRSDRTAELVD